MGQLRQYGDYCIFRSKLLEKCTRPQCIRSPPRAQDSKGPGDNIELFPLSCGSPIHGQFEA
jgi:hypothetical protein